MRKISDKEYAHEKLGEGFVDALSTYDTERRVEILVDNFLGKALLQNTQALDVGCGLGFFSERMQRLGAHVTACDLGASLVDRVRARVGCNAVVADVLSLTETFGERSFDVIVSSECIEHTPDPEKAIVEMGRVLKPGGYLSLSTPNILWWPAVKVATLLKLRPFDGLENFSTWSGLRRCLHQSNIEVLDEVGLHLFPFQFGFHELSRWVDKNMQFSRVLMINICILGKKESA
jgi:2-polyprenyl-6-hydroxyphenyl methylase/3-demethylubiquinone-9 3-methyltransferase